MTHVVSVHVATQSEEALEISRSREFRRALERFLERELGSIVKGSLEIETETAGDPDRRWIVDELVAAGIPFTPHAAGVELRGELEGWTIPAGDADVFLLHLATGAKTATAADRLELRERISEARDAARGMLVYS